LPLRLPGACAEDVDTTTRCRVRKSERGELEKGRRGGTWGSRTGFVASSIIGSRKNLKLFPKLKSSERGGTSEGDGGAGFNSKNPFTVRRSWLGEGAGKLSEWGGKKGPQADVAWKKKVVKRQGFQRQKKTGRGRALSRSRTGASSKMLTQLP